MLEPVILERLTTLDPEYVSIIGGDFSIELANQLGELLNFDEDKLTILSNAITLFLLFFLDFDSFTRFIMEECEISVGEAKQIAGAVIACLPEGFAITQQEMYVHFAQQTQSTETAPSPLSTPQNISDTIHISSQDSLLGKT